MANVFDALIEATREKGHCSDVAGVLIGIFEEAKRIHQDRIVKETGERPAMGDLVND